MSRFDTLIYCCKSIHLFGKGTGAPIHSACYYFNFRPEYLYLIVALLDLKQSVTLLFTYGSPHSKLSGN